jgi:hypothetical protein
MPAVSGKQKMNFKARQIFQQPFVPPAHQSKQGAAEIP